VKAKNPGRKYYKMKHAPICNMDVRIWASQTKGNVTTLLSLRIGLFDYPYPNMIDYILNTIPMVRRVDVEPTLLYTKRETTQWASSRIKHGFLVCKEDYQDIETKLNINKEVISADTYHGKVPTFLSEFNVFECIDRAVLQPPTSEQPIVLSDVFYYESNK